MEMTPEAGVVDLKPRDSDLLSDNSKLILETEVPGESLIP